MSRWLAVVVAVALFGPAGPADARTFHHCRGTLPVAAACDGGPTSGYSAAQDWSSGYVVDFAYAAVRPTAGVDTTAQPPAASSAPPAATPTYRNCRKN